MKVTPLVLEGALTLSPAMHQDHRGFFAEIFRRSVASVHEFDLDYVQENVSYSASKGTIRGLHWQAKPAAQAKLVRVNAGSILDVIVDIRPASPTFGSHLAIRLDALSLTQIFVPTGFAHGFCTLESDTVVAYRVNAYFSAEHERGIRFDDPHLNIAWPIAGEQAITSAKDQALPLFHDVKDFA